MFSAVELEKYSHSDSDNKDDDNMLSGEAAPRVDRCMLFIHLYVI